MALSIFPLLNDHHNHLSPECFHLSNLKPDPLNIWHSCLPLVPGTRHSTSFLWTWLLWVPHISWVVLYLLTLINNAAMNSQGLFLYRYVFSVLLAYTLELLNHMLPLHCAFWGATSQGDRLGLVCLLTLWCYAEYLLGFGVLPHCASSLALWRHIWKLKWYWEGIIKAEGTFLDLNKSWCLERLT